MRSVTLTGILLALASTGASLPATAQSAGSAPPRIEVIEPIVDLGELMRGIKVDTTFRIRNTGGSPLKILGAKPG
jgi:hypothetical protein